MVERDERDIDDDFWRIRGITGLPDVTIGEAGEVIEMPPSLKDVPLADIAEYLQRFGALCAYSNTVLGALESKCIILRERLEQAQKVGTLRLQQEKVKGTKEELAASIVADNPDLEALHREYTKTRALKAQAEKLHEAYAVARDTFSRQVTNIEMDTNTRERHWR